MGIDERLERMAERQVALTRSVQLLATDAIGRLDGIVAANEDGRAGGRH
jgi:hypothetical protein